MDAFHVIVQQRRGGYCFVCNTLFSALLRHLGYRVSEVRQPFYAFGFDRLRGAQVAARVNSARNTDARTHGYAWTGISHMALVVDVETEPDRYLVDVGFGGGSSTLPVALKHQATAQSLTPAESYELRQEPLPGADTTTFRDLTDGWTLYRRFTATQTRPAFETACYHFLLASLAPSDWIMLNQCDLSLLGRAKEMLTYGNSFNSFAPQAIFAKRCIVTRLRPDGNRDTYVDARCVYCD